MNNLNELAKEIHEIAVSKGFWDTPRNKGEMLMLIVSELSEALEADRKDRKANRTHYNNLLDMDSDENDSFRDSIKDSFEDELADAFIRIMDTLYSYCEERGDKFRNPEYYTIIADHGESYPMENIGEEFMEMISSITDSFSNRDSNPKILNYPHGLGQAAKRIINLCMVKQIDLSWHIRAKMNYNKSRPHMHGKKY